MRTHVTRQTPAIKARSTAVARATASMNNAEGGRLPGSPFGLGFGGGPGVGVRPLSGARAPGPPRVLPPPPPPRTPRQMETSFRNSYRCVIARDGATIVATGRALSDGVCNAYIVDVWTQSAYRRRGIGRRVVEMLCQALPGQHVYLFTDDRRDFY